MTTKAEQKDGSEAPQELVIPKAFVSKVTTNLKTPGAEPRSVALGPLTLLVGPSGSGKTSLVDAVCLALAGASPTRGLGKASANLKRALPDKAEALIATATLSIDETATWSLGREDKDAVWSGKGGFPLPGSGALLPAPGAVISVSDALDLLLGYDKNRLLAILDAVPSADAIVTGIDNATAGMDRELSVRLEGTLPGEGEVVPAGRLRQIVRAIATMDDEFARGIKACEAFKFVGGLGNLEEIELGNLEKAFALQLGGTFVKGELDRVEKQLAATAVEVAETTKLIESTKPGYLQSRSVIDKTLGLLESTITRMTTLERETARCPGCAEEYGLARFTTRRDEIEKVLESSEAGLVGYLAQRQHNLDAQAALVQRQAVLSDLLTTYGASAEVDTPRLVELRARKADAALSLAAGARAAALARYRKTLDAIESVLLDAAASVVAPSAEIVRRRANRVLPRGREMRIQCNGKRVNVGQSIDKGPIVPCGALSGSERVIMAVAFAIALQSRRQTPVSLLVVDEVMMDRRTMKSVLAGLSKAFDSDTGPTQILVCTSEWSGKVPAGWILREVVIEDDSEDDEAKPDSDENAVTEGSSALASAANAPPATPSLRSSSPQQPEGAGAETANEAKPQENTADRPAEPSSIDDLL